MATEIKMPQLSDTMAAGKILRWVKNEGDSVSRGDVLAEVETEKANLEIEAFQPGTLLKIMTPAGTSATVGETIAFIGQHGEAISSALLARPENTVTETKSVTAPAVSGGAEVLNIVPHGSERLRASPLARKLAEERNVDLAQLHGSGPNGRIIRKDVESAAERPSASTAPQMPAAPSSATAAVSISGGTATPFSKMRAVIARRMQESVRDAPHFYTTTSIAMAEAKKLREILKRRADFKGISINHMIMKAAACALSREPRVNRCARDDQIFEPAGINIGIVTALEDGLLIPVVHGADKLSLKDLVFEAREVIERARAGRPTAQDLSGATFSISNLGMFDVESFTAIISPGQGAILAVGAVREEAVVQNGHIVPGLIMKVTLSVDHRVIDGVMSGRFLGFFKEMLETPALLLV